MATAAVGRPKSDKKAKMIGVYFPPADLEKLKGFAEAEARSDSAMVVILTREAMAAREKSNAARH